MLHLHPRPLTSLTSAFTHTHFRLFSALSTPPAPPNGESANSSTSSSSAYASTSSSSSSASSSTAYNPTIPFAFFSTGGPGRAQKRPFSTKLRAKEFHFDTHQFVQRLERKGVDRAQAEGIMTAMTEVIDEGIRNMISNMVTKAEQEKSISLKLNPNSN
ncbi:hypothetical protein K435DRAFT_420109 [Dendrothele bispora CBS 962.96]|uniref:Uncharacterized protein n=1 Tax=Dendrothele bispora (strain CBS 962.96) TaxID=1314807 RepID=A0A4S8L5J5_DENBC|nr:hypothetical protein K435DRAFT_420109 [Dendrothele bispora CBS 962.96]